MLWCLLPLSMSTVYYSITADSVCTEGMEAAPKQCQTVELLLQRCPNVPTIDYVLTTQSGGYWCYKHCVLNYDTTEYILLLQCTYETQLTKRCFIQLIKVRDCDYVIVTV